MPKPTLAQRKVLEAVAGEQNVRCTVYYAMLSRMVKAGLLTRHRRTSGHGWAYSLAPAGRAALEEKG